MADKVCMFTGHRSIRREHLSSLPVWLENTVEELIGEGYTEFCVGGAIGFDTLAALKIIEKKEKYGFLKLRLFLPCKDQDSRWNENYKRAYRYILGKADSINYACESYCRGCMHKRNREMVKASDVCVAYCVTSEGGTYYTVNQAKEKGMRVIEFK